MRKKLRILSLRELATRFFNKKNARANNKRAKELYFSNFANHMTMKKNGEFEKYCKYHVPKEQEHIWSCDVKEKLMKEICTGSNLLQVVQLARVNLPEEEILTAFKTLSESSLRDHILATIMQLAPLFSPVLYQKILELFD